MLCALAAAPAIAVEGAGQVSTWGDNTYGQLGDGSTTDHLTPKLIPSLTGVQQVEGGREHVLALTTTGAVLAWGWNKHGQVGNGSIGGIVKSPVQVLTNVIDIGAGHYSSFAVKADGTVWGWGQNTSGQIGTGTTALRVRTPRRIEGLGGVSIVDVAGGRNHAIALTAGGNVYAWGSNQYGQLGNGTWQNSSTPVLVSSLTDVVGIFAGRDHNLAVRGDGSVWSWGYNGHGELGDGTGTNRNAPVRVVRLERIRAREHRAGWGRREPFARPAIRRDAVGMGPQQFRSARRRDVLHPPPCRPGRRASRASSRWRAAGRTRSP